MTESFLSIQTGKGLLVDEVSPDGIGDNVGIEEGDRLLSINDQVLRDVIDYKYFVSDEMIEVKVIKGNGEILDIEIEKEPDEDLGLGFPGMRIRQCPNKCIFCFVDQNPSGQRKALYIRDEDYRFSFLYGNYITLTNLSKRDRQRIFQQKLSPLYVSVHATDNELRRKLLVNPKAPDILETMKEFINQGISLQTQIVICPGLNDGVFLEKSIQDLAALYPGVASLAIVPVGLTKFRDHLIPIEEVTPAYAKTMVQSLQPWQDRFRNELGTSFVFPSDEFFIKANEPFPSVEYYEELLQFENGVGMVSLFLREATEWLQNLPSQVGTPKRISLVTGFSFGGYLQQVVSQAQVKGLSLQVFPIQNNFFGPSVTVTGLLTGGDIIQGIRSEDIGDLLVIPSVALNEEGTFFLDNTSPEDISKALGIPVQMVQSKTRGLWEMMGADHGYIGKNTTGVHHWQSD
ncbi:MAG TPA: DUF512 domain-containing protein [Nitrospiria bacterium]|jgi:putative radical SAM enzyme (TIGR03279 family)